MHPRTALTFVFGTALLAACRPAPGEGRVEAAPPMSSPGEPAVAATNPKLENLLKRLAAADEKTRDEARKELEELGKGPITTSDGALLLRAAGKPYPKTGSRLFSTQADLIEAAAANPDVSYIPILKEIFPKLEIRTPESVIGSPRPAALELLAKIDDPAGARALLELLDAAAQAGAAPPLWLRDLERKPRFAEVYFPRILRSAKGPAVDGICRLALAFAEKEAVKPSVFANEAPALIDAYRATEAKLGPLQAKPDWIWSEDYASPRASAGLLLDVMGHAPAPAIEAVLRDATRSKDPRLAFFAIASLLHLGQGVDAAVVEPVAASAEMRLHLHTALERADKLALYPRKWATAKAFAEGGMVQWLSFPTELGRAPDEIELMKVVSEKIGPDVLEWYLFRFRTKPPHWAAKDGWMAGVSGPYKKSTSPTPAGGGDTFSQFTRWDAKPSEEHVADVRKLIAAMRERSGDEP